MNEFEELIKNYNIKNKEDYDFLEKVKNIIERKENIIKEVREILNNKRTIMTTQLLNCGYCNYEELLYQVDEEIRKILDKVGDSNE